jgi:hypothetical protein
MYPAPRTLLAAVVLAACVLSSCAVDMSQVREAQAEYDRTHTIRGPEEWPADVADSFSRLRSDARIILEGVGDNPNEIDFAVDNRFYPYVPRLTACEATATRDGVPLIGDGESAIFGADMTDIEWIRSYWVDAGYEVVVKDDLPTSFSMAGQADWGYIRVSRTYTGDPAVYTLRIKTICAELEH